MKFFTAAAFFFATTLATGALATQSDMDNMSKCASHELLPDCHDMIGICGADGAPVCLHTFEEEENFNRSCEWGERAFCDLYGGWGARPNQGQEVPTNNGLPPGVTVPPNNGLPPGVTVPPNNGLPPGVTVPPNNNGLPPGVTVPPQQDDPRQYYWPERGGNLQCGVPCSYGTFDPNLMITYKRRGTEPGTGVVTTPCQTYWDDDVAFLSITCPFTNDADGLLMTRLMENINLRLGYMGCCGELPPEFANSRLPNAQKLAFDNHHGPEEGEAQQQEEEEEAAPTDSQPAATSATDTDTDNTSSSGGRVTAALAVVTASSWLAGFASMLLA